MKTVTLDQIRNEVAEADGDIHNGEHVKDALARLVDGDGLFELLSTHEELAVRGHSVLWALASRVVTPAGRILKDNYGPISPPDADPLLPEGFDWCGGPAFPINEFDDAESKGISDQHFGMSLRDWFAGQAMAAIICDPTRCRKLNSTDVASHAYAFADAMIEERKR